MLQDKGEVKLKFRLPFFSMLLTKVNWNTGIRILNRMHNLLEKEDNNMSGYIIFPDGVKKSFTIDSADSPFLFDLKKLCKLDVYFKMQYPVDLKKDAFALTDDIQIPWVDCQHVDKAVKKLATKGERQVIPDLAEYKEKIKPLMIGPRQLSRGLSHKKLRDGYERYIKDRRLEKSMRLMCYFGAPKGPKPEMNVKKPDFDSEADIMGFFGNRISHPNEKRARVARYISDIDNCDARIIGTGHSDSDDKKNKASVVPLSEFCAHVAKFQYNFNVSGYRRSIPNRFIESFMVGTGIVTDKLAVKWYKPFDNSEVVESVEMGYLPMEEVAWGKFEQDLRELPEANPEKIVRCFEDKWHPVKVARYILDTVRNE